MNRDEITSKVAYITNATELSGVGHQAQELAQRLGTARQVNLIRWHIEGESGKLFHDKNEIASIRLWPGILGTKSVNWIRLGRKINPLIFPVGLERKKLVFHLTNQTLSFLARKFRPAVVTVHDLIEQLEPQNQRAYWLNRYLYSGIKRANHIICVSQYTKKTVQNFFSIPDERISVIYNGVGREFRTIENFKQTLAYQELRSELELPLNAKVVLYVGSDHPRKNVITAVQAAASAAHKVSWPLYFIKIGRAGIRSGRSKLLFWIDRLGFRESVRIIENIDQSRLNQLYNLADVLIYPSQLEGFGMPPLQAMAAGTPVVTSNAASLPEVVGTAALLHKPHDVEGFARSLATILTDDKIARDMRRRGKIQASQFSWDDAARKTLSVYGKILS